MPFIPYYLGGWEDYPDTSTPMVAAALDLWDATLLDHDTRIDDAEADITALAAGKAPLASPTFTGTVTAPRIITPPVTLTDAATIAIDAALGNIFRCALTADRAIGAPTNPVDGQYMMLELTASGGARVPTFNTIYEMPSGVDVGASPAIPSGQTNVYEFTYRSSLTRWILIGERPGVSQGGRWSNAVAQSIPNLTVRGVYLPTDDYTTPYVTKTVGTTSTGSTFILNRAGLWRASLQLAWAADDGGIRFAEVAATGQVPCYEQIIVDTTSLQVAMSISGDFRANAGDAANPTVLQSNTGAAAINLDNAAFRPVRYSLTWIAP